MYLTQKYPFTRSFIDVLGNVALCKSDVLVKVEKTNYVIGN